MATVLLSYGTGTLYGTMEHESKETYRYYLENFRENLYSIFIYNPLCRPTIQYIYTLLLVDYALQGMWPLCPVPPAPSSQGASSWCSRRCRSARSASRPPRVVEATATPGNVGDVKTYWSSDLNPYPNPYKNLWIRIQNKFFRIRPKHLF
jgi:hypothetical protein